MLVLLLVVLAAAGVAQWTHGADQVALDEPFSLKSRLNTFASPEYFGSVKVRGRRIKVHVDSLRVSVYRPQVWNDLTVRGVLRGPDKSYVDSSRYVQLPTDSTTETADDGTVLLRELPSMSLQVPRGAMLADHRLVLEISTPRSPISGKRAWNPAHLDSLLLRRAVPERP